MKLHILIKSPLRHPTILTVYFSSLPKFHLFAEVDDEGLSQLLQLLLDLPVAGAGLVLVQAAVSLHLVLQPATEMWHRLSYLKQPAANKPS